MWKAAIGLCLVAIGIIILIPSSDITGTLMGGMGGQDRPLVIWYTVAKRLGPDFLDKVEAYRPDIVLLTVFAEDDVVPMNRADINLTQLVEEVRKRGTKVYFSFSLFSRSALPFEEYQVLWEAGIPYSEQNIHMADYSQHLKETDPELYHYWFDYYLERDLDPEEIPHVERKPVEGFYTEPGHYTSIDPLFKPYRDFIVQVIEETIQETRPDGLAFDHGRFFTFDAGYNQDIRDWILERHGLDIWNYTPAPPFQLDAQGWEEEDRIYYNARAEAVSFGLSDILEEFPQFEKFGTTIGMIDAARANGQYVELQKKSYDKLLLMEYGSNPEFVRQNLNATILTCGCPVILGIFPFEDPETAIQNINIGIEGGADGIYLLGYDFPASVHQHLLEVRQI